MTSSTRDTTPIHFLPAEGTAARIWAISFFRIAPILVGCLGMLMGQDASWDFLNYHWYNAYAFLNDRLTTDIQPSQVQFFFSPFLDVPFYLLATYLPLKLAFFILSFVQGLNVICLFMLSHACLTINGAQRKVAVCAALSVLGMLGGMGISEIGTTFNDNLTSLGVFASMLMILHGRQKIFAKPDHAILCGLPLGIMTGLKLTTAIYSIGFCLALLLWDKDFKKTFKIAFFFGLGMLVGFVAAYGAWGWFLFMHYESPLFPFYNSYFKSSFVPYGRVLPDFKVVSALQAAFFPYYFSFRPRLVNEIDWQDFRLLVLYTLLIVAACVRLATMGKKSEEKPIAEKSARNYVLWAFGLSYAVWVLQFCIYRYIVAIEMVAPLLIVLALSFLPIRNKFKWVSATVLLVLIVVTIQPGDWGRAPWADKISAIEGKMPAKDTMILMAGMEAYAHLIPAFPSEISFVRIQSRSIRPERQFGLTKHIDKTIRAHKGPLMLLIQDNASEMNFAKDALKTHRLRLDAGSCRTMRDKVYTPERYKLCRVIKQPR